MIHKINLGKIILCEKRINYMNRLSKTFVG